MIYINMNMDVACAYSIRLSEFVTVLDIWLCL